jgi:hypothetical protein
VLLTVAPALARAADPPAASDDATLEGAVLVGGSGKTPDELLDPAFEKIVELRMVQDAFASRDTGLLADAALLMAQAEHVLHRPHKTIPADKLLAVAIRLAGQARDADTLKRLAAALADSPNAELKTALQSAQILSAQSRAVEPPISLEGVTPAGLETYIAYKGEIPLAQAIGDRAELEAIQGGIETAKDLSPQQRQQLLKMVEAAISATPETPPPAAQALSKLRAAARGNNISDQQATIRRGWTGVVWGPHFDHLAYAVIVASMAAPPGSQAAWVIDMIQKAGRIAGSVNVILQVVQQRRQIAYGNKFWDGGVATYNHWHYEKVPYIDKGRVKWREVKVSEPNTFQPYVRYRPK